MASTKAFSLFSVTREGNNGNFQYGRTKQKQTYEVREYFINLEIENKGFGKCFNLIWISEKVHASIVKTYCQKQF